MQLEQQVLHQLLQDRQVQLDLQVVLVEQHLITPLLPTQQIQIQVLENLNSIMQVFQLQHICLSMMKQMVQLIFNPSLEQLMTQQAH